jgi:hypothetical protein
MPLTPAGAYVQLAHDPDGEQVTVIRTSAVATFLLVAGIDAAAAVDLKDLMPCRSAALRMCDRSQGMNEAALRKCGATLASRHHEVSRRCMDVLSRYGQLSH